jgi:hypothetical protein
MTAQESTARPLGGTACWTWQSLVFLCIIGLLCFFWWEFNQRLHLEFWAVVDDYPALSLAHALNIEYWVTGGGSRRVGYFQSYHPGIPFQVLSWAAFRAAALFYPQHVDPVTFTLDRVEPFWLAIRLCALLLTAAGLTALWWKGRQTNLLHRISACIIFFTFAQNWTYGLTMLGNETFALPLSVAFFSLADRSFSQPEKRPGAWAALGAIGGLCLLLKLNYIVWPASVIVGMAVQILTRALKVRQTLRNLLYFSFGFLMTVGIAGSLSLTYLGVWQMLKEHTALIFHTGYYGSGEFGLVAWANIQNAFQMIKANTGLWLVPIVLFSLTLGTCLANRTGSLWLQRNLPYTACLWAAVLFGCVVALKHFRLHYLIPCVAVFPMIVLWLGRSAGKKAGTALALLCLIMVFIAAKSSFHDRSLDLAHASAVQKDCEAIAKLPIDNGGIRLWSYRVNSAPYLTSFVLHMSGILDHYYSKRESLYPSDEDYSIWSEKIFYRGNWITPDESHWQYAVFDRALFPSFEAVPGYFRENGQEVESFSTVLVVARKNVN